MRYIDYCGMCKYAYTKNCKDGSKECNQEKARILLEISNSIAAKTRRKRYELSEHEIALNYACHVLVDERKSYNLLDNMVFNREFQEDDGKTYIIKVELKNE